MPKEQMPGVLRRQRPVEHHYFLKTVAGLLILDSLLVGSLVMFPKITTGFANGLNFQSNGLAKFEKVTFYQNTPANKDGDVVFNVQNGRGNTRRIIENSNQQKGLYLQGYVSVPSLGIYQPIYQGTSEKVLSNGAGTMKNTQTMGAGNYVIFGQNVKGESGIRFARGNAILSAGSYFSSLATQSPDLMYLTDGQYIYTYEDRGKNTIGAEDYSPLDDAYPLSENLNSDAGNNLTSTVGQFPLTSLGNYGGPDGTYQLSFDSDYPYLNTLDKKSFDLTTQSGNDVLQNVNASVQNVSVQGKHVTLTVQMSGDAQLAFSTVGAEIKVQQNNEMAFLTMMTSANKESNVTETGILIDRVAFDKATSDLQSLFPNIQNAKKVIADSSSKAHVVEKAHLSWWQEVLKIIGGFFLKQASWFLSE